MEVLNHHADRHGKRPIEAGETHFADHGGLRDRQMNDEPEGFDLETSANRYLDACFGAGPVN